MDFPPPANHSEFMNSKSRSSDDRNHSASTESSRITIRLVRPEEVPQLVAMTQETIRRVNSRDYSPIQIQAWSDRVGTSDWKNRLAGRIVLVADLQGDPVGMTDLEENGHLDRFYVSAHHQRCGIGRRLLAAIETEARKQKRPRVYLEASLTARPFFESQGYRVVTPQTVIVNGIEFKNFQMEKIFDAVATGD